MTKARVSPLYRSDLALSPNLAGIELSGERKCNIMLYDLTYIRKSEIFVGLSMPDCYDKAP